MALIARGLGRQSNGGSKLVGVGKVATEQQTLANGFFIGAGGLAVVAGIMALFTDWQGYRDALKARTSVSASATVR